MIGFSLMHTHPLVAIVGITSCLGMMAWLLPAVPFAIARRRFMSKADVAMLICAVAVAGAVVIPDRFFA